MSIIPTELVEYIIGNIKPPRGRNEEDIPCWMLENKGNFSVKTAWNYIRHKEEPNRIHKWIWTKGIPFKMAFMMWRLWKFKVPVDDRLRRWGLQGPSRCWCCENPDQETLTHVFLRSNIANRTWSYFCSCAGLSITGLQLREVIMLWWGANAKKDIKPYYRAIPSFIIWELWNRRNKMKHERKNISLARIIHNVTRNMFMLIKVRRPKMICSGNWPIMLKELEGYCPSVKVTQIKWEFPLEGWIKYNTDGASRGNPGLSSYAFCLRDEKGDLIHAEGASINNTTNTVAEAKAILEASKHCKQALYNKIIIQTDSMLLYKVLGGQWESPWIIRDMIEEIKTNLVNIQHIVQHVMREGNQLADYIANQAIEHGNCIYTGFASLEPNGRRILNSDKIQSPYLRISLRRDKGRGKDTT
ncbi:hypothetical protein KY290_008718 [Solanum tuberosum]|uniref:RNase H type-1 domain-containing protein n=1 Tax=Solanum tuberosum TaxID=4113 RepID=A0ABQ7W976_SOLTU|nr:hypothetical protein KY290_008718 [Solanum tuberosum]